MRLTITPSGSKEPLSNAAAGGFAWQSESADNTRGFASATGGWLAPAPAAFTITRKVTAFVMPAVLKTRPITALVPNRNAVPEGGVKLIPATAEQRSVTLSAG